MDKTIRKYDSFDEMKGDEYRYWQSRPVHERLDAVEEMVRVASALKGWEMPPDVPRSQRPFVRLPCPWRKYLIAGGYAVIFHAQPRYTKNIDLLVRANPANAAAIFAALAAFGAPLENIGPRDFCDEGTFFRFGNDPLGIDILPSIPGVDFEAVWERRVEGVIDPQTGQKAFFISKEDPIAAKLATGRMRDLGDVEDLRAASRSVRPRYID